MSAERLAFGEYSTPEATQATARVLFLATVAELVPDVLATLRDDVLPVYAATYTEVDLRTASEPGCFEYVETDTWALFREAHPDVRLPDPLPFPAEPVTVQRYVPGVSTADPEHVRLIMDRYSRAHTGRVILCQLPYDVSRWHVVGMANVSEDLAWYPDLLPLREALEAWSTNHHVHEPWVHDTALAQLDLWREYPTQAAGPDRLRWLSLAGAGPGSALQQHEHRFVFEHAGWDPTRSTRAEGKAAIAQAFKQQLSEYLDRIGVLVTAADGFERSTEYRSLQQHMKWLVLYQMKAQEYSDIARHERRSRREAGLPVDDVITVADAVRKAITRSACLVGIERRDSRGPGRPSFSRTTGPRDHGETLSRPHKHHK